MMKNKLNEATGSGSSGKFKVPIVLAPQDWKEKQLGPFIEPVYHYDNAELAYQEADGDYLESPEERKKLERKTDLISRVDTYLKKFYTGQNDEDGSNLAQLDRPERIVNSAIGPLKEDLAVWFGTKKKPKGSSQPKGPWVNICRKDKNGKHPPCGRDKAESKGYPKCRGVHVASKMSDSEKRSACQQKRKEEKKNPKTGTGNKPTMTSYKPRNESLRDTIKKVLKEQYDSNRLYPVEGINNLMKKAPYELKKIVKRLNPTPCVNDLGEKKMCYKIPEVIYVYMTGRY
jgi:hypothetical protein